MPCIFKCDELDGEGQTIEYKLKKYIILGDMAFKLASHFSTGPFYAQKE